MDTATIKFSFHSDLSYVDISLDNIIRQFLNYDTRDKPNVKCLTKSYKVNTYNKGEVDLWFSSLIGASPAILVTIVERIREWPKLCYKYATSK